MNRLSSKDKRTEEFMRLPNPCFYIIGFFLLLAFKHIPNFPQIEDYEKDVIPLDYEFYLDRGRYYNLWGVSITDTVSFFVDTGEEYQRLHLYHAVLFEKIDWSKIPQDWQLHCLLR